MKIQAPKGTRDVLPKDSYRWQKIEADARHLGALAGYREVRTPVFEYTELFARGVGDTTDVVQKEMYTFTDRGDRSITLKPEGTAGVVRAMLEAHMDSDPMPIKMMYVSTPVFRYDKPQSGRYREHHQIGVEAFGAKDPSIDAEIIDLALKILRASGIGNLRVAINTIGCPKCRPAYHKALKAYIEPMLENLCGDCNTRYERNPLRVLDCKVDSDKLINPPQMLDYLCEECAQHFEQLQANLNVLSIGYEVDPKIVRGLDYYEKTVFEIIMTTPDGGELTVCGGGRYDGLVKQLGGPSLPGIGFGMGVERLLMLQDMLSVQEPAPRLYDVFVCTLGDSARIEGIRLVEQLRDAGIKADLDHAARSLKAQFKYANKVEAPYVIVLAEDELNRNVVKLRNMATSEESEVPRDLIVAELVSLVEGVK